MAVVRTRRIPGDLQCGTGVLPTRKTAGQDITTANLIFHMCGLLGLVFCYDENIAAVETHHSYSSAYGRIYQHCAVGDIPVLHQKST